MTTSRTPALLDISLCGCPDDQAAPTACGDRCCGEHLLAHAGDCAVCAADVVACWDD